MNGHHRNGHHKKEEGNGKYIAGSVLSILVINVAIGIAVRALTGGFRPECGCGYAAHAGGFPERVCGRAGCGGGRNGYGRADR